MTAPAEKAPHGLDQPAAENRTQPHGPDQPAAENTMQPRDLDQPAAENRRQPRVAVLSFSYHPPRRVRSYVDDLVSVGVEVDLLLAEVRSTEELDIDPRVKVHTVLDIEETRLPVRRIERAIVFSIWEKALGKARTYTVDRKALRPLDVVLDVAKRGQGYVSRGFHYRLFWPAFRVARPWILTRRSHRLVESLDLANVDRIVAGDPPAVPAAWRLARRYPDIRVTSALDRRPYVD